MEGETFFGHQHDKEATISDYTYRQGPGKPGIL